MLNGRSILFCLSTALFIDNHFVDNIGFGSWNRNYMPKALETYSVSRQNIQVSKCLSSNSHIRAKRGLSSSTDLANQKLNF